MMLHYNLEMQPHCTQPYDPQSYGQGSLEAHLDVRHERVLARPPLPGLHCKERAEDVQGRRKGKLSYTRQSTGGA